MMALRKKMLEQEPGEIELLLPWHAAGTLNARDARRVEEALARDPELARQYAVIQQEYAETIGLNETLGAPSARAMQKLFTAIDAEPARKPSILSGLSTRISGFFASLSPRTLAWATTLGAFVLVAQAGVIGTLVNDQGSTFKTASLSMNEPVTRNLVPSPASGTNARALVRFAPDAKIADINALLEHYNASIVDTRGGLFHLQFGNKAMSREDLARVISQLQREEIVNLAVAN